MLEEGESELSVIVNHMDPCILAGAVFEMADVFGEERVTKILKKIAVDGIQLDPEMIELRVWSAIGMDDEEWDTIVNTCINSSNVEDLATDIVINCIEEEFKNDVEMLVGLGMREKANKMMRLIAQSIRNCDSAILNGNSRTFLLCRHHDRCRQDHCLNPFGGPMSNIL